MDTKQLEKLFKILANKKRLDIIFLLYQKKKMPSVDIAKTIRLSRKSTSKHLRMLYSVDYLEREYIGFEVYYSISHEGKRVINRVINNIK